MEIINGRKGKRKKKAESGGDYRRKLLAKVHIGREELGISDDDYRDEILGKWFGESTAAALTDAQLETLLDAFKAWGWKPKAPKRETDEPDTVAALRHRVNDYAELIPNGQRRMQELCPKILGVSRVEWCDDVNKLKRMLAVLGNIRRREVTGQRAAR